LGARLWHRLRRERGGQITTEVMLLMAVIVGVMVVTYYLLAPPIREGFLQLAAKIIRMKP